MLQTIQKSRISKAICLFLASSIFMLSCKSSDAVTPKTESVYSGEELFRGIFLLEGEVANKIQFFDAFRTVVEETEKQNTQLAAERHKTNTEIVAAVHKLNPAYFDELKQAVTSQNFTTIDEVLGKGAALMQSITIIRNETAFNEGKEFAKKIDFSKYDFTKTEDVNRFIKDSEIQLTTQPIAGGDKAARQTCLALAAVVAAVIWEVAVVVNVVAGVTVAAVALAVTKVKGPDITKLPSKREDVTVSSLEREMFIKQVAFNLN